MYKRQVLEYGKKEEMDFTVLCAILVAGAAIPLALSCLLRLRMLEHGAGLVLIPLVAAFMSDTMAVSYTHLDVYKRQDPVFLVPSLRRTFAQLTAEEKNAISHRGNALRKFAAELKEYLANNEHLEK